MRSVHVHVAEEPVVAFDIGRVEGGKKTDFLICVLIYF